MCVFVIVCDNPGKCVLYTLQLVHVETKQTPEERVVVIKVITHQGISYQNSSLIRQILSNSPEIKYFNKAIFYNFANMISKGEICIKHMPQIT